MPNFVELAQIPADFSENNQVGVFNPLAEDFTADYGGKPFTIKAGEYFGCNEKLGFHLAKHLAAKILMEGLNDDLLAKFPGTSEEGREKWKMKGNKFISKEDIRKLRNQLVFAHKIGEVLPVINPTVPEYAAPTLKKARKPRAKKVEDEEDTTQSGV